MAVPPSSQPTMVACGPATNIEADFLSSQNKLTIFLKDGYSFFKANAELLTRRFADPTKQTEIIIVHPDSPYMEAVAAMDDKKLGYPESQKSDCLQAVRLLQEIRQNIIANNGDDCAARVAFVGQDNIPTWNGAIGDAVALVNLYTTRPYRGPLTRLTDQIGGPIFTWAKDEASALIANNQGSERNLWEYKLPVSLQDLRR